MAFHVAPLLRSLVIRVLRLSVAHSKTRTGSSKKAVIQKRLVMVPLRVEELPITGGQKRQVLLHSLAGRLHHKSLPSTPCGIYLLLMQRFFSYERVSSFRQVTDGKGLDRQASKAEEWCAAQGVELDQELVLVDAGRSAFHGENLEANAALSVFMQKAEAGELGEKPVLLAESLDRLTRIRPRLALEKVALRLINSCEVTVVSLFSGKSWSAESVDASSVSLIEMVLEADNAFLYSQKLSERIKASWDQAYKELEAGRLPRGDLFLPPWCKRDGDQIKLVPERVKTVQRIFDAIIDDGHTVIAGRLNADKVPTLQGKSVWSRAGVKSVLDDVRVLGQVRINYQRYISAKKRERRGERADNERIFEDLLPIIITPEQMQLAKTAIAARSNPKNGQGSYHDVNYIGQGVSRCVCGAIVGTTTTSSGRKAATRRLLRYAKCRHRISHSDGCRGLGYRLESLNAHLLTRLKLGQLQQLMAADTTKGVQIKSEQAAISRLQAQLMKAEEAEANAARMFKKALKAGQVDPLFKEAVDESRADAESCKSAFTAAQQRLAGLRHEIDSEEFGVALKVLFDAFASGSDTAEQRRAINVLMRRSGLKITLDNKVQRVGMSIGDGEIDWQAMNPRLDAAALRNLLIDSQAVDFELDAESIKQLMEILPSVDGVADMTPLFEALGIKSDEAGLIDLSPKRA